MRPVGEIRQALLSAAELLETPGRAPTQQELAATAGVGLAATSQTLKNMVRAGVLQIVRTRKVPYRNRPVAEYAPATKVTPTAPVRHQPLVSCWMIAAEQAA